MMTRFINSHGVGTVSEINYSLNESDNGKKMDFVLEIKRKCRTSREILWNGKKRLMI